MSLDQSLAKPVLTDLKSRARNASRTDAWQQTEKVTAVLGIVLIAMRIPLTEQLLTLGDLLAIAALPMWFPVTRRYAGARVWLFLGALCIPGGLLLSSLNAVDHEIRIGTSVTSTMLMLSLLCSVGFLLWARQHLTEGALVTAFGLGLLLGLAVSTTTLFATNPYKYGFALPVAILTFGLAKMSGRRGAELFVALVLCVVSTVADARSDFAILLLTAALLAWQMRPTVTNRRGSAFLTMGGIGVAAVAIYNLGQALILDGLFGRETQVRTQEQLGNAGFLILGGRPELGATLNLMRVDPLGFGSGTIPNYNDIRVAKQGMAAIGYDPGNGYVERWMFGNGYRLHSAFGDLWAIYGLLGFAFAALILLLVLRRLGNALVARSAGGAFIFGAALLTWNTFFTPLYGGIRIAILVIALALIAKPAPPPDPYRRLHDGFRRPVRD